MELFRRFGYFPTESSEHSAEYVPWFMRHDSQIERFRIFVGDYLARSEENLRELESLRRALHGDVQLDALKLVLRERISMCARKGFDAVELGDASWLRGSRQPAIRDHLHKPGRQQALRLGRLQL